MLLGHIVDVAMPQGAAVGFSLGVAGSLQPARLTVLPDLPPFGIPCGQCASRIGNAGLDAIPVLGMNACKHMRCIHGGLFG